MDRAERDRKWRNVELWVTSIHTGQLVYERHSVHETCDLAMKAAVEEGHAVRTLLVEIKHEGEVLWTAAGDRRGRQFNRLLAAGLIDEDGSLIDEEDENGCQQKREFGQDTAGKWGYNRDPILDDPFEELELTVRVWNRLPNLGVQTIRDLTQLSKREIRAAEGLGRKSLAEIEEELARYGWTLQA